MRYAWVAALLVVAAAFVVGACLGRAAESQPAPASQPASRPAEAAFDEAAWRKQITAACAKVVESEGKLRPEEFAAVAEPPFVLVSDLPAASLQSFRRHTVAAAAKALWATYFDKRPTEPIRIFLFKDADSYKTRAAEWFGDRNVPHFGYFRRGDRVMVMNIATGGGTLVHEMVHALIAPDFPDVPDWFNEGLGSLYEQCNIREDRITGLVNWRLPALQKAIADKKLRPLRELITAGDFRTNQVGLNYAQARYLCLYLQQTGKLVDFYKAYRDNYEADPWGDATLEKVTGRKIEDLEKVWLKWVAALKR